MTVVCLSLIYNNEESKEERTLCPHSAVCSMAQANHKDPNMKYFIHVKNAITRFKGISCMLSLMVNRILWNASTAFSTGFMSYTPAEFMFLLGGGCGSRLG